MIMNEDKILIKDDNGNVKEYSIISIVNLDGKEKEYVIYTDFSINDSKELNMFSGILGEDGIIQNIKDENEIHAIDEYIASLVD